VRLLDAIPCFFRRRDVLDRDELFVGDAHPYPVKSELVSLLPVLDGGPRFAGTGRVASGERGGASGADNVLRLAGLGMVDWIGSDDGS
jgi:hypothetical protein